MARLGSTIPRGVTFTWNPDPAYFAERLSTVGAALENRALPLAIASETMQADIRERFDTETDPSGEPWEDWSETYYPVAEAYPNIGILQQSGELRDAASSSEAMVVTNDTVFYQTRLLPHYGLAHESGTDQLPQRSFLGMSDEAAATVFATFGEWFDNSIDLFTTRKGRIGIRHALRGAGGGFVSRSSFGKSPLPRFR